MQTKNLVGIIDKLSKREQLAILWAINRNDNTTNQIHHGKLPFIEADYALDSLEIMGKVASKGSMVYRNTASRLRDLLDKLPDDKTKFQMYLDDSKVARRFGTKPWLGKVMTGTYTRTTAGLKWSLPDKDYIRDKDVLLPHRMSLKPIRKGLWIVFVAKSQERRAVDYLMKYCM